LGRVDASYYSLSHLGDATDPVRFFADWFHERWCCGECGQLVGDPGPIDLVIAQKPTKTPLNFVPMIANFMRVDLLEAIGRNLVREHFYLGKVTAPNGVVYEDFVSFRGKRVIRIRGDEKSIYRPCPGCGAVRYFPIGPLYVLESQVDGIPLAGCRPDSLLVDETIYSRLRKRRWTKVGFQKLSLLDRPLDGRAVTFP
jgi:hypothetical protein